MLELPEISMDGSVHGVVELKDSWCQKFNGDDFAQIVIVQRGECWFEMPESGDAPVHVPEGAVLGTVGGGMQIWRGSSNTPIPDDEQHFEVAMWPDEAQGATDKNYTRMFIGRSPRSVNKLLPAFPKWFYISPKESKTITRLKLLIKLVELESSGDECEMERQGVIRRLSEVMTVIVARHVKETLVNQNPRWPEMAVDSQIMRALRMIENEPARDWTVETLASEVGMGRSTFALRFRELVGDTPVNALNRIRMLRAAKAIRDGQKSISLIAQSIGYSSEPAFIKAFARYFGAPPGRYRASNCRAAPDPAKNIPARENMRAN